MIGAASPGNELPYLKSAIIKNRLAVITPVIKSSGLSNLFWLVSMPDVEFKLLAILI